MGLLQTISVADLVRFNVKPGGVRPRPVRINAPGFRHDCQKSTYQGKLGQGCLLRCQI